MKNALLRITLLCLALGNIGARAEDRTAEAVRYLEGALRRDYARQEARVKWSNRGEGEELPALPAAADDATFLRRACVDLAGRLPRAEEVRAFLADVGADKRGRLTDALLKEPAAAEVRFRMLAEAFRVTDKAGGQSQAPFIAWLRKAVADDLPFNELVKAMITAEKGTPAAGLIARDEGDAIRTAVSLAESLVGQNYYCAMCHDHPFNETTQRACYEFAACFAPMKLPASYKYRDRQPGEALDPVPVQGPGEIRWGSLIEPVNSRQAREQLAETLAGRGAKRMRTVAALRVWRSLFGMPGLGFMGGRSLESTGQRPAWREMMPKGFENSGTSCFTVPDMPTWVDDDFGRNSYVESVEVLSDVFEGCGLRLGELQRILARTEAYGREPYEPGDPGSTIYLTLAPLVRRLPSEVIWDAVVTRLPAGQHAWLPSAQSPQVPPEDHPLRLLGRARREWPDESHAPVTFELTRFMMNSPLVGEAASAGPVPPDIDTLVLSILGRPPTPQERAAAQRHATESPATAASDLAWALFNTSEFLFER